MNNKDPIRDYKILSEYCDRSIAVGEVLSQEARNHLARGWELYGPPQFMTCKGGYDIFQAVVRRET